MPPASSRPRARPVARACLIGRPRLWGLAAGGEAGVARVLELFRSELDRVMGLSGTSSLGGIGSDLILR